MPIDPLLLSLIDGFCVEAQGITDRATRTLLELERETGPGPGLTQGWKIIARALHTLKGTSASVGLGDLSKAMHELENELTAQNAMSAPPTPQVVDRILGELDRFMGALRATTSGGAGGAAIAGPALMPEPVPSAPTAPMPAEEPGEGELSWRINGRQIARLTNELERLRELAQRFDDRKRLIDSCVNSLAKLSNNAQTAAVRATLSGVSRSTGEDAEEVVTLVGSLDDDLRTMSTQPMSIVLHPLQRAVRDLCQQTGKRARLSIIGAELSVDRRLLERVRGPLAHLVRNAVDHGIELPEVRDSRGKHSEGAITIRVEQEGNIVRFEIADDGGGLDADAIRERARALGIRSEHELAALDEAHVNNLIFLPGFSTRTQVTETSGRGVGLDVVRSELERLSGEVEVSSTPGKGTLFHLSIPTEFGSAPLMIVRSGEQRFALPMSAVEEVIAAGRCDVHETSDSVKVLRGEQLLPVHELASVLRLRPPSPVLPEQAMLFLHALGGRAAVVVDSIEGDVDLMIRALPGELRSISAYQGVATLAGGELVLVLRPKYLVTPDRPRVQTERRKRALVIDDSLTARAMHRTILEAGGYAVNTVSSVSIGLEQLRKGAYDVVICDVAMEGTTGIEFARSLRADPRFSAYPLILVSAHDNAADRQVGLSAGADAYLGKRECASGALLAAADAAISERKRRG